MIKDNKEKQREKNGSGASTKSELTGSQVPAAETTVKEEPGTESHLNGVEEGESNCKKAGARGNGSGNGATTSSSNCTHSDLKANHIGSTNSGTVTMATTRAPPTTQGSTDLCMAEKVQEVTKTEDSSNSQDKPASCGSVKTEINGNSNNEFSGDSCEGPMSMGIGLSGSNGPPPNGVQPLPSNVINKQPGTMEAQYMQQQSQIFVFSTNLANKSAEAVLLGQFPSIIAFHCAQPGTKKYLEKHPLKMNQFNRQNPAQWLNSLAQMKQKGGPGVMKGMNPMGLPGGIQAPGDMGPNSGGGMGIWNQNNNMMNTMNTVGSGGNPMMQQCPNSGLTTCPGSNSMPSGPMKTGMDSPCLISSSPNPNSMLASGMGHHSPNMPPSSGPMLPTGTPELAGSPIMNPGNLPQPSLTGVKVPDENLTPQQRQHREEQLATLRKMQQMLFPEHQSPMPDGGNMCQQPDGMMMHGMGSMMNMGPGLGPNGGMPQKGFMMGGMPGPNQITPTSMAAQIEWQKLQHQFYEERKKKGGSGMVMGGPGSGTGVGSPAGVTGQHMGPGPNGPGPRSVGPTGPRAQGPPPPYHQTTRSASVPTALPSPNPGSPNNPTSNLSLPSPRAASGLNSPADPNRQPFGMSSGGSNSGRPVGPGPSPTGIHNTSLDSPGASRPLNPSNPGTPVSTHLSPSTARKEVSQNGSEFPALTQGATQTNQQPPVDGMFCRTLQSLAQQKQQQPNQAAKEPNLMPVPSPQQIQYLNTFEGQELTIQKQPNTSLKDTNIRSPSLPPANLDSGLQNVGSDLAGSNSRMSGPGTPLTPTSLDVNSRYPPPSSDMNRFPIPSPHTPGSTPTEGKGQQRFAGPSPQSQGCRTPGMEPTIKTPTTEVASRFLSTSPQLDGMGPPRFPGSGSGPSGNSPALGNQTQNFIQQSTPSMSNMKGPPHFLDVSPSGTSVPPVDVSPTNSGSFPCVRSENVPLNPNSSGIPCSGKSAHFDPITSMAQMSQQLTNNVANSPGGQNPGMMGGMPGGPGVPGMLPFNSPGMHPMQMNEIGSCQGLSDGQPPGSGLMNPMVPVGVGQSGPPGFVGMQLQNVPPHSYSPNSSVGGGMVQCSGAVNTTPSIVHTNSCASPKPGNMMMGMGPSRGSSPYSASPVPQRVMGRPPGPNPYSGANVQVKASAPNTIQYLPAKPQAGNSGPRGPPSLDFLQRFANPLSNLDSKVPTHNLQYFPNGGQPNNANMSGLNVPLNRPNGVIGGMNSQMGGIPGPNCGPVGGHVGGHMGNLNGPMMGPNGPLVGMNIPMSGGMPMGPGGPGIGMAPIRGGMRPGGMMRMQQMGGPGVFGVASSPGQPVGGDQMFGPGPNPNLSGNGPNSQMFVPGPKSSPLSLGNAPDASQPLPPSMGQSNTFKNSPFIGPTTADPNYAQQFHNFQQQLYATNTRSQMSNHAMGPNQSFFVPK